jgi:ribonuclease P protein subunit POP4
MTITPFNLINHNLIGLTAHIVGSSDNGLVCRTGRIVDESREIIRIESNGRRISIPKRTCTLDIRLEEGSLVRIDGCLLRGRPEDRLKKRISGRW